METRLDALVVAHRPGRVRVEAAAVGEAGPVAGAEGDRAAVVNAADERIELLLGGKQVLHHQDAPLEAGRLVFVQAGGPLRPRPREVPPPGNLPPRPPPR